MSRRPNKRLTVLFGAGADRNFHNSIPLGVELTLRAFAKSESLSEIDDFKDIREKIESVIKSKLKYNFQWQNKVKQILKANLIGTRNSFNLDFFKRLLKKPGVSSEFRQAVLMTILAFWGKATLLQTYNNLENSFQQIIGHVGGISNIQDIFTMEFNVEKNFEQSIIQLLSTIIYDPHIEPDLLAFIERFFFFDTIYDEALTDLLLEDKTSAKWSRALHFHYALENAARDFNHDIINHNEDSYYHFMKDISKKWSCDFFTLNYTKHVQKLLPDTVYLHGELLKYVDLTCRSLKVSWADCHIPIPAITSMTSTKPIVGPYQIDRLYKFQESLRNSEICLIYGYGFTNQDSHITNAIIEGGQQKKLKKIVIVDKKESLIDKYDFQRVKQCIATVVFKIIDYDSKHVLESIKQELENE